MSRPLLKHEDIKSYEPVQWLAYRPNHYAHVFDFEPENLLKSVE